jgi:hypothetical protein
MSGKVIRIEAGLEHDVSEVICVQCGHRWLAARPSATLLKNIQCPGCDRIGYVIETGQVIEEGKE